MHFLKFLLRYILFCFLICFLFKYPHCYLNSSISCFSNPNSSTYKQFYHHLRCPRPTINEMYKLYSNFKMHESDYYLIILVNARHLDYTNNRSFFKTVAKHPSDGSKNGDVGHAWIYLHGYLNGEEIVIEGGHSGELGICQPKYFDGVMDRIQMGEKNPIAYLWEDQKDGYFQMGSGKHVPTFAAKIDLTKKQFNNILKFISPDCYNYRNYSITGWQCSSFVAQVAQIAGWTIECEVKIPIERRVNLCGESLILWDDPIYNEIVISSPDVIEKSLISSVRIGRAEYALNWYLKNKEKDCFKCKLKKNIHEIHCFPQRLYRWLLITQ